MCSVKMFAVCYLVVLIPLAVHSVFIRRIKARQTNDEHLNPEKMDQLDQQEYDHPNLDQYQPRLHVDQDHNDLREDDVSDEDSVSEHEEREKVKHCHDHIYLNKPYPYPIPSGMASTPVKPSERMITPPLKITTDLLADILSKLLTTLQISLASGTSVPPESSPTIPVRTSADSSSNGLVRTPSDNPTNMPFKHPVESSSMPLSKPVDPQPNMPVDSPTYMSLKVPGGLPSHTVQSPSVDPLANVPLRLPKDSSSHIPPEISRIPADLSRMQGDSLSNIPAGVVRMSPDSSTMMGLKIQTEPSTKYVADISPSISRCTEGSRKLPDGSCRRGIQYGSPSLKAEFRSMPASAQGNSLMGQPLGSSSGHHTNHKIPCSEGFVRQPDGTCRKDIYTYYRLPCPDGYEIKPDGTCVKQHVGCPSGYRKTADGFCEKDMWKEPVTCGEGTNKNINDS